MGADFIAAFCRWPKTIQHRGAAIPQKLSKRDLTAMRSRVDSLAADVLREIAQSWGEDRTEADARQLLHRAIDEILANPGRRDVELADLGGQIWVVTGHMPWGDPPTDAYPFVAILAVSGITEAAIDPASPPP